MAQRLTASKVGTALVTNSLSVPMRAQRLTASKVGTDTS